MLAPEAMQRLTLLINHVLSRERVATDRLRPHSGRSLRVCFEVAPEVRLPPFLPSLPEWCLVVTPAGLLEWQAQPTSPPDLQVRVRLEDPIAIARRALAGQRPDIVVEGDAALAGDVNWLAMNLRWDIADELDRLLGPAAAQTLVQAARALASALQRARGGLGAQA